MYHKNGNHLLSEHLLTEGPQYRKSYGARSGQSGLRLNTSYSRKNGLGASTSMTLNIGGIQATYNSRGRKTYSIPGTGWRWVSGSSKSKRQQREAAERRREREKKRAEREKEQEAKKAERAQKKLVRDAAKAAKNREDKERQMDIIMSKHLDEILSIYDKNIDKVEKVGLALQKESDKFNDIDDNNIPTYEAAQKHYKQGLIVLNHIKKYIMALVAAEQEFENKTYKARANSRFEIKLHEMVAESDTFFIENIKHIEELTPVIYARLYDAIFVLYTAKAQEGVLNLEIDKAALDKIENEILKPFRKEMPIQLKDAIDSIPTFSHLMFLLRDSFSLDKLQKEAGVKGFFKTFFSLGKIVSTAQKEIDQLVKANRDMSREELKKEIKAALANSNSDEVEIEGPEQEILSAADLNAVSQSSDIQGYVKMIERNSSDYKRIEKIIDRTITNPFIRIAKTTFRALVAMVYIGAGASSGVVGMGIGAALAFSDKGIIALASAMRSEEKKNAKYKKTLDAYLAKIEKKLPKIVDQMENKQDEKYLKNYIEFLKACRSNVEGQGRLFVKALKRMRKYVKEQSEINPSLSVLNEHFEDKPDTSHYADYISRTLK